MNLVLRGGHTQRAPQPEAMITEMELLLSRGIIRNMPDEDFAMVWDDCWSGGMRETILDKVVPHLSDVFRGRRQCSGSFYIPGSVGKHKINHATCVFSTLDLSGPHLGA